MCGIAGIIQLDATPLPKADARIKTMTGAIPHRGPDANDTWVSPNSAVALGHRRLAIVDLSDAGRQPMASSDGNLHIVFNGEIYNHKDIRAELEKKGYKYHSTSDTETILYAYQEWGEACLEKLRGMFALGIYNIREHTFFFARDRIGIKPFYYTIHNGQFIFASEIKAILALKEVPQAVDHTAVYHYLSVFAVPAPRTMFEGISKLPAGYSGMIKGGQISLKQYWDLPLTTDTKTTEAEWVKEIKDQLTESVKLRMMSDVPFGAYLSGGVDSSTLGVLMNNQIDRPLDTFTVGFKRNEDLNETQYARAVSEEFGFNYHEVLVDKPELKKLLKDIAYQTDEPNGDWVCFPLYYVSQLIHQHKVVVAQVGEGADELFCGYSGYLMWLKVDKATRWMRHLPKPILTGLYKIAYTKRHTTKGRFLTNILHRLKEGQELFLGGAVAFTEPEKQELFDSAFLKQLDAGDTYDVFAPHVAKAKQAGADQLQLMTYLEFKHRLPEILLMRVDKMSMQHSIEARVPFLDHKFVERMFTIPTSMKLDGSTTKRLLKKAVRGLIPDEIIDRKKVGFLAPIADWLREPAFMAEMKGIVFNSPLIQESVFNREKLEALFDDYKPSSYSHRAIQIWVLVQLALWYETWFNPAHGHSVR
jgi:asparagine synthase (glutamine-hydrolysing)